MRKVLKTMVTFVTVFAAVCGMAVPAFAADGTEEKIDYGEFTNEPVTSSGVIVSLEVESAVPDVEPPADAEFQFFLKVDGEFCAGQEYELYGTDGKQIYRKYDPQTGEYFETTDKDAPGVDAPFKTDRNGGFTLKDGQWALFSSIDAGSSYEAVQELDEEGPYVQKEPEGGGPRTGTVPPEGAKANFVDTFYPGSPGTGAPQGELRIAKRVLMPDGYAIPGAESEFTFEVQISSRPYANQAYTLPDGTRGTTDANGRFKLKGGQTAVFSGVETDRDYSVREVDSPEGWRQVSSTGAEGAVIAPVTYVEFTNAIASFAVTKRMEGGSVPDASFRFLLSDGTGPKAGAQYYLYDAGKNLTEGGQPLETGADGSFSLKAGQTALFTGMETGAEYTIHEAAQDGYIQTFPDGDYSGTVRGDAVPLHEFINAAKGTAKLTVKKADPGGRPLAGAKFKLRRGGSGGLFPSYAVLEQKDGVWNITGWGTGGTELATDENGQFVIGGFVDSGTYSLVETEAPAGYVKMKPVVFDLSVTVSDENELTDASLQINGERTDVAVSGSMMDGTGTLTLTDAPAPAQSPPLLPQTGGIGAGIVIGVSAAAILIGAAIVFFALKYKKKGGE